MNLYDKCQQAYKRIQEWRDLGEEAFDLQTDRMYLHDLVRQLQDVARKEGCVTKSVNDPKDRRKNNLDSSLAW